MTRHRGQKYLCEFVYNLCGFIYNLSLSKITSYNTFTTLLLGLRLSASFTWLLTKYVQLVCQTNHLSIYSHNFWLVDIKVVLQFTTCCLHVWLTVVFITHLRNTRLSIVWVQITMKYRTSSTFSSFLLSISYRHERLVSPNPIILCATYRKGK